jgi:hypothetical protein
MRHHYHHLSTFSPGNPTLFIYLSFQQRSSKQFQVVVQKVRFLLNLPNNIQNLVAMIGLAVGLLLLIPEIVFWAKSCCPSPEEPDEKAAEMLKS